MTSATRPRRRKQRAMARQTLRLCEAELVRPTSSRADTPHGNAGSRHEQARISTAATRAALRAAGMPPGVAATLCSRLRLIREPEVTP